MCLSVYITLLFTAAAAYSNKEELRDNRGVEREQKSSNTFAERVFRGGHRLDRKKTDDDDDDGPGSK